MISAFIYLNLKIFGLIRKKNTYWFLLSGATQGLALAMDNGCCSENIVQKTIILSDQTNLPMQYNLSSKSHGKDLFMILEKNMEPVKFCVKQFGPIQSGFVLSWSVVNVYKRLNYVARLLFLLQIWPTVQSGVICRVQLLNMLRNQSLCACKLISSCYYVCADSEILADGSFWTEPQPNLFSLGVG